MSQEKEMVKEIVEEIKFWVMEAKSDVYGLQSNIPIEKAFLLLYRTVSIINFIQGLLNDLSNMLEEDS